MRIKRNSFNSGIHSIQVDRYQVTKSKSGIIAGCQSGSPQSILRLAKRMVKKKAMSQVTYNELKTAIEMIIDEKSRK